MTQNISNKPVAEERSMPLKLLTIALIVLFVALGATGGWFFYQSFHNDSTKTASSIMASDTGQKASGDKPANSRSHSLAETPWATAVANTTGTAKGQDIKISTDFECGSMPAVTRITNTHFAFDFDNAETHWFAFRMDGVAGKTIRLDLRGVHIGKWRTLNPVFGYGQSLEEITQRAVAEAPLTADTKLSDDVELASNGPWLPKEHGNGWHFIRRVWTEGDSTLCMEQRFERDTVFVCMKYPYTPKYNEMFLKQIADRPHVEVTTVGKSKEGRPLQIVKIAEGTEAEQKKKPTILMYAREHADEHDSSWAVAGALESAMRQDSSSQSIYSQLNILLIPMLDPDAAAYTKHQGIISTFSESARTVESQQYAKFFQDWANSKKRLDLIVNLHNVESSECEHIACPLVDPSVHDQIIALHHRVISGFKNRRYSGGLPPWGQGTDNTRLGGWMSEYFGSVMIPYEINSQESHRHLALNTLNNIGIMLMDSINSHLQSTAGRSLLVRTEEHRLRRLKRWNSYTDKIDMNNPFSAERSCLWRQQSANAKLQ